MDVVHPVCCGIDVHQAQVTVCLRRVESGSAVSKDVREFSTTTQGLLELQTWLLETKCPVVAMESTGVYWKPVYHILGDAIEVVVGNARAIRNLPGKKTDKADAEWIAELLAHGLIRPSFVPPPETCALRDLTRTRVKIVQMRAEAKNRIHKTLEDCNIKLSTFVTDIFGVSGRKMLDALVAGERDAKVLAQMAKGLLRLKISQLELALTGQFTEHHGELIRLSLEQLDLFNEQLRRVDSRLSVLCEPLRPQIEQLCSIPGVQEVAARVILSEIGNDMTRFGSAARLASWAGMCPGNNESAGKRRSGKMRKGNRWLRRLLCQCAWAARKTNTYLGRSFRQLEKRLGGKKAAMAIGHKILVISYHLLQNGTFYEEALYETRQPKEAERQINRAVKILESFGLGVTIRPLSETFQPDPKSGTSSTITPELGSLRDRPEQAETTG